MGMDAELIARIGPDHRDRLAWFEEHQGDVLPSPVPLPGGLRVVHPRKGIYKPAGLPWTLSIKIKLNSRYADSPPVPTPGGGWLLEYPEETPPAGRDTTASNEGLKQCIADRVPVGVLYEHPPARHRALYDVLGLALPVRWSDGLFYFESLNPKPILVVEPVSDVLEEMANAEADQEIAADHDELSDFDPSQAAVEGKRAQRREQVRRRVEAVLGKPLREEGPDYALPDGRLVAIYYSKIHDRGDTFLGVKNRIRNDDVLVLLLGDETYPEHLVFPRAEGLLRYKESFTPVGNDRVAPPIRVSNGSFVLRRPSKGLAISLDDRIDAYYELLFPTDQAEIRTTPIGRNFREDDEDAVPRAAAPGVSDPDLVGRGNRAHKHTRNALGAYLKSLGIQPLDPVPSDPPFDLAWWKGDILYVTEVKSLTKENEERQLRLGLGQLLQYSHLLRKRTEHVVPVLVPELKPRDPEWGQLCKALNVKLVFPPDFEGLIDETTDPSQPSDPLIPVRASGPVQISS
jgi:hypothetical protein